MTQPTITNPYAGRPREQLINIVFWVDPDDHKFITAVYPFQGRWQNLMATVFKHLINELKRRNITTWSIDSERAITDIISGIVGAGDSHSYPTARHGQSPVDVSPLDRQANSGHDNRRTESVHGASPGAESIPADPVSRVKRGRRKSKKGNPRRKA